MSTAKDESRILPNAIDEGEVLKALRRFGRPATAAEIAAGLEWSLLRTEATLKRLADYGLAARLDHDQTRWTPGKLAQPRAQDEEQPPPLITVPGTVRRTGTDWACWSCSQPVESMPLAMFIPPDAEQLWLPLGAPIRHLPGCFQVASNDPSVPPEKNERVGPYKYEEVLSDPVPTMKDWETPKRGGG